MNVDVYSFAVSYQPCVLRSAFAAATACGWSQITSLDGAMLSVQIISLMFVVAIKNRLLAN